MKVKNKKIEMNKNEFIKEHKRLIKSLKSLKKEEDKQERELKKVKKLLKHSSK